MLKHRRDKKHTGEWLKQEKHLVLDPNMDPNISKLDIKSCLVDLHRNVGYRKNILDTYNIDQAVFKSKQNK